MNDDDPILKKVSPLRPLPNLIFASRWLQLPLYLGLIAAQGVYVVHFLVELWHLIEAAFGSQAALQQLIASIGYKQSVAITSLNETVIMLVVLALIDVVSIVQTPMWVEGMTAGKGWIALALVVFGTWKPLRVVFGAYLFGGVTVLQLYAQGFGLGVPSQILSMLPYVATIVVLVIICRDPKTILLNQPVSLGRSFHPDA